MAKDREISVHFADEYSMLHFATGIVAYFLGVPFWMWFLLHATFEVTENSPAGIRFIRRYLLWMWPGGKGGTTRDTPDTPINMVGDQFFALIGWLVPFILFGKRE